MLIALFKKVVSKPVAIVTTMALSLMASTAFGRSFYENNYKHLDVESRDALQAQCTDEMAANTPVGYSVLDKDGNVQVGRNEGNPRHSVKLINLTTGTEACVARAAGNISFNQQVWLVESTNGALRTLTIKAAHEFEKITGRDVIIALYKDTDQNDDIARASFWSDGHERGAFEIGKILGKDSLNKVNLAITRAKEKMIDVGKSVQERKDLADKNQLAK